MIDASKLAQQPDISKLLQQLGATPSYFSLSSRYRDVALTSLKNSNEETINYLRRRFVPKAEKFFVMQEHTVKEGDRLDNITHQYLGDPERFWQICDANDVLLPDELTEDIGNKIKITLPEGIPGNNNA
jgi:nucleoid-associated protein YgaU